MCTLWLVGHPWEHLARLFSTQLAPSVCLFALKQFAPGCSSGPSWLSSQHAHGNTCSLAANHYFDQGHAVKIESVHAHPKHPYSHTNCHCKYPLGAALSCRGPVRVTFRCMYRFVLKTGTFTGSCLLTMGSHHTNRLSEPIP